jgi:hypothetical protein
MWNGAKGVATFSKDGAYRFESDPGPNAPKVVIKGTYRDDEDLLYITFKDLHLENLPPRFVSHEKEVTDKLAQAFDLGLEKSANVTWSGKNAFESVSLENKKASFTRKK